MLGFLFTDHPSINLQEAVKNSASTFPLTTVSLDAMDSEAVVEKVVKAGVEWRVRYRATTWSARCIQPGIQLRPKDVVHVVDRHGLTLFVEARQHF